MKRFSICFYGRGGFVKSICILAKNKTDALSRLRATGETILEIISVRNLDFED